MTVPLLKALGLKKAFSTIEKDLYVNTIQKYDSVTTGDIKTQRS